MKFLRTPCISAVSNLLAGRFDPAKLAMARALELDPNLRVSNLRDLVPFRREKDFAKWAGALRRAGLPD